MLDYEWGNPSNIMLTGNEDNSAAASDQTHRQIFDHYASQAMLSENYLNGPGSGLAINMNNCDFNHQHQHQQQQQQQHFSPQAQHHHMHHSFFDPRAFQGGSSTNSYPPPQPSQHPLLSLDPLPQNCGHGHGHGHGPGLLLVPKSEDINRPMDFVGSRIGLNLGGRTYFSSSEDDFVSRLYRRSRPPEPGSHGSSNSPRCQAEGCNADLSQAKHYHRRHKVCEFHSKAATVIAAGLTQRFCQQCSRFHLLSEFDNGKRSCRKRLADHNRRRRKTQHPNNTQEIHKPQNTLENAATRSPPESGTQSSSSVTVAVSPPDYFRQRSYQSPSPSTNSSSMFFSTG